MPDLEGSLTTEAVYVVRPALERELLRRGWGHDVSKVRVLRHLQHDVDRDGREESYFVVGIPEFGGPATLMVHNPFRAEGNEWVTLLPFEAGFRDLFVSDINGDGVLEIIHYGRPTLACTCPCGYCNGKTA